MKVLLQVNFPETDNIIEIENPSFIPNLGDAVDNYKGAGIRYYVELKEFYYHADVTIIYLVAKKKA